MRAYRWSLAATSFVGLLAVAAAAADVPPAELLRLLPAQRDLPFEFDTPSGEEIAGCKGELQPDRATGGYHYTLRDAQGRLLRRFSDTNGKKDAQGKTNLDQWSYYKDGFEVYREVDLDEDKVTDECRWMNSGGTRIAVVKSNRIASWKRLSAEEASKVLVHALVTNNLGLLETVLATPAELAALGVPKSVIDRETQARTSRAAGVEAIRKGLVGWDAQTVWMRFDGTMPHVIPADAGLKDDLVLYENAFIFAGPPSGEINPMKYAYLQCPDVVKIGETWKFVGLPRAINPAEPVAVAADGGLRVAVYGRSAPGPEPASTPELEKVLRELAEHDAKAPGPDASKQEIATYHYQRIEVLKKVLGVAQAEIDRLNYTRQVIDSLAAAYQTGLYAAAAEVLDKYAVQPLPIGSYAGYRKVLAEYTLEANEPGADFIQVQKNYLAKLDAFLKKYPPHAEEVPEVLFQLASINEFNAEEDQARAYYGRLAREFKEAEAGQKAAGALRRLDLVGKPLALAGTTLTGKPISAAQYKGKPLLVAFWTSTADPVRRDLPDLKAVYQKYRSKGFEILGVNLDPDQAALEAFLKEAGIPWPQIHEPDGMDSRLANEFGIITLPTMILVDADGKVVSRNVRNAADLDRFLEKLTATPSAAALNLGGTR